MRDDLAAQLAFLRPRSPSYATLLHLIAVELDNGLEDRLARVWRGRKFGAFYERPLLLLNGLRLDALREGRSHPLWRGIAGSPPDPASISPAAVVESLAADRPVWETLAARHVQTNETSRAVAWRWPARLAERARPTRALALYDVGASAGLNLVADRLPLTWNDDNAAPLDASPRAPITCRLGFDLRPLDATRDDDALWLRACVWPKDVQREARLESAIRAFRDAQSDRHPPAVRQAALETVPVLLPAGDDGALAVASQTIVRDYVPPPAWAAYVRLAHVPARGIRDLGGTGSDPGGQARRAAGRPDRSRPQCAWAAVVPVGRVRSAPAAPRGRRGAGRRIYRGRCVGQVSARPAPPISRSSSASK